MDCVQLERIIESEFKDVRSDIKELKAEVKDSQRDIRTLEMKTAINERDIEALVENVRAIKSDTRWILRLIVGTIIVALLTLVIRTGTPAAETVAAGVYLFREVRL